MKSWIESNLPEGLKQRAHQIYSLIPQVPQLPELAPEKQASDFDQDIGVQQESAPILPVQQGTFPTL